MQLNNLKRPILITPAEVIFHADTDHTLDERKVEQSIIIAEERFMRGALTYELYEEFIRTKNITVTSLNLTTFQTQINVGLPIGHPVITLNVGDIVNSETFLSAANLELWRMYVHKLAAEAVMIAVTPGSFVQMGSTGIVHAQPNSSGVMQSGVVTPSLQAVKWKQDKNLQDRYDPLLSAMHTYICHNKLAYPNYRKPCDCDVSGIPYKKKTDFVLGIYDQDPSCGCNNLYED